MNPYSPLKKEKILRGSTHPIPDSDLANSPDSIPRTEVIPSSIAEPELLQEIMEPAFGINISHQVFTPSPSSEVAATIDQPMSEHSGEKSGDIVPLDFPSSRSHTL